LAADASTVAAGVREVLVRGLRELGEEFTEFGWVLDEVNWQLTTIAEDVAQTAATTREVADKQQQTLVELAMLRREARGALLSRADLLSPAVPGAPSADEERAAALDAGYGLTSTPARPPTPNWRRSYRTVRCWSAPSTRPACERPSRSPPPRPA
jgi:hypothetical protein